MTEAERMTDMEKVLAAIDAVPPTDAEVEAIRRIVCAMLDMQTVTKRKWRRLCSTLLRAYDAVCRENGELKRELKQETAGYKAAVIASWEDKASIANQAARIKVLEDALRSHGYHAPGKCYEIGHGFNYWAGDHCTKDEPALEAMHV